MGLWLMLYNNVVVYGCGLGDLVTLVGSLSVLVIVRVYAGGPSAHNHKQPHYCTTLTITP